LVLPHQTTSITVIPVTSVLSQTIYPWMQIEAEEDRIRANIAEGKLRVRDAEQAPVRDLLQKYRTTAETARSENEGLRSEIARLQSAVSTLEVKVWP
jgi:hypothetical protein